MYYLYYGVYKCENENLCHAWSDYLDFFYEKVQCGTGFKPIFDSTS